MNALSHNVIMADRKKLKSANGMYLGSTGSGKSFAAKRELINVFLATQDRIVIVDPMGEYSPLVRRLGGQVIEIAPDSPHHINPMDIEIGLNDEDSPLSMKADFLLSLCELVVGGKDGLQPIEKTVIDRCVRLVYRELALGLEGAKMPLLQSLYEELLKQPEPEAKRVATALELYCTGSLNLFNHPTNVDLSSRVVCIVLKGLGENLRKIAMHVTNEFVTSAVNTNYQNGAATWCYFDEFHILLRDPLTASYFVAVWKMLRKKGCVPSALTQNVKDLLASREIENILDNTDFLVLLSQAQSDRAIIAKQLGISEHQLSYITHSNSGEGLLFYLAAILPADSYEDKGVYTFSPYQVLPVQVQNTVASGRDRRVNPTKTAYMVYYRDTSGSGYQWSQQALTRERGQEIVDAGAAVERRVLSVPADRSYITVEPGQTAESYTTGLRQKYITALVLAGAYVVLYAAAWCVVVWLKKEKG